MRSSVVICCFAAYEEIHSQVRTVGRRHTDAGDRYHIFFNEAKRQYAGQRSIWLFHNGPCTWHLHGAGYVAF